MTTDDTITIVTLLGCQIWFYPNPPRRSRRWIHLQWMCSFTPGKDGEQWARRICIRLTRSCSIAISTRRPGWSI